MPMKSNFSVHNITQKPKTRLLMVIYLWHAQKSCVFYHVMKYIFVQEKDKIKKFRSVYDLFVKSHEKSTINWISPTFRTIAPIDIAPLDFYGEKLQKIARATILLEIVMRSSEWFGSYGRISDDIKKVYTESHYPNWAEQKCTWGAQPERLAQSSSNSICSFSQLF